MACLSFVGRRREGWQLRVSATGSQLGQPNGQINHIPCQGRDKMSNKIKNDSHPQRRHENGLPLRITSSHYSCIHGLSHWPTMRILNDKFLKVGYPVCSQGDLIAAGVGGWWGGAVRTFPQADLG